MVIKHNCWPNRTRSGYQLSSLAWWGWPCLARQAGLARLVGLVGLTGLTGLAVWGGLARLARLAAGLADFARLAALAGHAGMASWAGWLWLVWFGLIGLPRGDQQGSHCGTRFGPAGGLNIIGILLPEG